MTSPPLHLRDLEYVDAVARLQHFGNAAKLCHVSQPALSAQIKKVEELLGVVIFERTRRSVKVTAMGEVLVTQIRTILEEANRLLSLATQSRDPMAGDLHVGAIASLGPYVWPHFLPALKKRFPKLTLFLHEGLTLNLLNDLKAGTLDAFLASDTFHDDAVDMIPLFREPFLLAAPKGHDILKHESLTPAQLNANDMILLEEGHCLSLQTLELCSPRKRSTQKNFHATSVETLKQLVAMGHGYTLLPYLSVERDQMRSALEYRNFEKNHIGRKVILVFRKSSARREAIELLADFIRMRLPAGVEVLHATRKH